MSDVLMSEQEYEDIKDISAKILFWPNTKTKRKQLYKVLRWKHAGLSLQIDDDTTVVNIAFGIKRHDMVCAFLTRHWDEVDFEENYFHHPGEVNYYKVLNLAVKEEKEYEHDSN